MIKISRIELDVILTHYVYAVKLIDFLSFRDKAEIFCMYVHRSYYLSTLYLI